MDTLCREGVATTDTPITNDPCPLNRKAHARVKGLQTVFTLVVLALTVQGCELKSHPGNSENPYDFREPKREAALLGWGRVSGWGYSVVSRALVLFPHSA